MKVLLSIKPEFAEKILSGEKCFEYRKKVFKRRDVNTIIIYATQPVGKVIGEFSIKGILSAAPDIIWDMTQHSSGITQAFFDQYFQGRNEGYAIQVKKTKRYSEPLTLDNFIPGKPAPQSFCYLH